VSPADPSAGTSVAKKTAPRKKAPAPRSPAKRTSTARRPASRPPDAQLRDALVRLTGRDAMAWPHATGLGQMMMWVSAYTRGLLTADHRADSGPYGLITH